MHISHWASVHPIGCLCLEGTSNLEKALLLSTGSVASKHASGPDTDGEAAPRQLRQSARAGQGGNTTAVRLLACMLPCTVLCMLCLCCAAAAMDSRRPACSQRVQCRARSLRARCFCAIFLQQIREHSHSAHCGPCSGAGRAHCARRLGPRRRGRVRQIWRARRGVGSAAASATRASTLLRRSSRRAPAGLQIKSWSPLVPGALLQASCILDMFSMSITPVQQVCGIGASSGLRKWEQDVCPEKG